MKFVKDNLVQENLVEEVKEETTGLPDLVNSERRSEERISMSDIPVEISGTDRTGHFFSERAFLKDVSDLGCRFEMRTQLSCGNIISVKPVVPSEKFMTDGQALLLEVMWAAIHRTGCTVGTRKLQGKKLEHAKFSPPDYSSRVPAK